MSRIVFDIETLAYPFDDFDQTQKDYLVKFATTEEEIEEVKLKMNLSPFTAMLLAIGMYNPDSKRGKVIYQAETNESSTSDDGSIDFIATTEIEMLKIFWEDIIRYDQFITFNGRGFDSPFLMLKSALLGVKPSRNLLPYRYDSKIHCDLLDQLTFYGAVRRYNLDFYCKAFGIKSPKSDGISGLDMKKLFEEKRYHEIARYCLGDVVATSELFRIWDKHLNY